MLQNKKKILEINNTYLTIFLAFSLFLVSLLFLQKAFLNATAPVVGSVDFPQFYEMSKDFWNKKDIFKITIIIIVKITFEQNHNILDTSNVKNVYG